MSETVTFKKEMSISHRDFLRLLARAVGHSNFELVDGKISVPVGEQLIEITLSEEYERRIALIVLPVTNVTFTLTGYSDAKAEMARIDLHFQRGGG